MTEAAARAISNRQSDACRDVTRQYRPFLRYDCLCARRHTVFWPPQTTVGDHSVLSVINPAKSAAICSVPTADFLGALAVRPDGVIFGGNGDDGELFTIDPLTGTETLVGSTGLNFVGALDFAVPEPATFLLFGSGLMAMAVF